MVKWNPLRLMVLVVGIAPSAAVLAEPPDEEQLLALMAEYAVAEETVLRLGDRLMRKKGEDFPDRFKCTRWDYRRFHLCFEPRFFDPSARVYFDSGTDDPGEVDIFHNGGLNATIDFASAYLPWRMGRYEYFDHWSWGPMIGVGISSPAQNSEDGTVEASDAPVVILSLGLMIEYELSGSGASFGLEFGRAIGFSSDEALDDNNDSATYVGMKISIPSPRRTD